MIKLNKSDFHEVDGIMDFNIYHSTNYKSWSEFYKTMGYDWLKRDAAILTEDLDYEIYEKWHTVINTPLYRAMREDEKHK